MDAHKNVVLKLEDICNESLELLLALISTCFNVRKKSFKHAGQCRAADKLLAESRRLIKEGGW